MSTFTRAVRFMRPRLVQQMFAIALSFALILVTVPQGSAAQDSQAPPDQANAGEPPSDQAPTYAQQTPEQLQQLVAPIALYPD